MAKVSICQLYIQYVQSNYGSALLYLMAMIVDLLPKMKLNLQRTGSDKRGDVDITPEMLLKMKKKPFLANTSNKQKFINLIGSIMENEEGIQVRHSHSDADYNIVISVCAIAEKTCGSCRR